MSETNGRVYIGQTKDAKERLKKHNNGYVKSTSADVPWRVIAVELFKTREEARWRERQLKKSKGTRDKWLKRFRI